MPKIYKTMTSQDFTRIKDFFTLYTARFHSDDPSFQRNIELKRNHSIRVWKNTKELGRSIYLSENDQLLAETAGLLHDIGRFKQFEEYGTFSDKKSVNHAWLSTEVIKEKKLLDGIPKEEQERIITSVYNHNKKRVPGTLNIKEETFVKLLRDADKLDIWKVVTDYYCETNGETNNTLQLDLPDEPVMNPVNIEDIKNERLVDLKNLETLNDFKLLQIGWIYDLNFKRSFQLLMENDYLGKIYNSLPKTEEIEDIKKQTLRYLEKNAKQS
jgi:HD superfamily phosphodiesterase